MTFVLNKCYGGFNLSSFAVEKLGFKSQYDYDFRLPEHVEALADLIEEYGSEKCSGRSSRLRVVEIPDTYTDYEVNEYDGIESLTYVIGGKIHHA